MTPTMSDNDIDIKQGMHALLFISINVSFEF